MILCLSFGRDVLRPPRNSQEAITLPAPASRYSAMRDSHLVRRAPSRKMRQAVRVGERPVGCPSESGFENLLILCRGMLQDAGFDPQPRPLLDRLPTSDTLWMAGRKLSPQPGIRSGAIFRTLVCYSRDARSGVRSF